MLKYLDKQTIVCENLTDRQTDRQKGGCYLVTSQGKVVADI